MKFFTKKNQKKDPLLQTYFASLLSLILCVAMFLGTTFAWFSSDVTSSDNQIFVGTLEVSLSHRGRDYADWVAVNAQTGEKILNPDIRWEPGYTTVEWLKLENTGDLSLNYRLKMSSLAADALDVLSVIGGDFTVYVNTTDSYADYAAAAPGDFEALKADESWEAVGTLTEVMAGKSLLDGSMNPNDVKEFGLAIHMDELAGKEAMGQKLLNISVKLEAWQDNVETDAFNSEYDRLITNVQELEEVFATGGKAIMLADVDMKNTTLSLPAGKSLVLDLNGHKISGQNKGAGYDMLVRVHNGAVLELRDSSAEATGELYYLNNTTDGAVIHLEGILVQQGGTIRQTGTANCFGVDVRPNEWATGFDNATEFRMLGGKVVVGSDAHAVRLAVNSAQSYTEATASFIMEDGQLSGKDGLFIQMLNGAYRPVQATINGGSLTGTNAAIRVYAPAPQSVVGADTTPVNLTLNGGSFTSGAKAATAEWVANGIVKIQNTSDAADVASILELVQLTIKDGLAAQ